MIASTHRDTKRPLWT